MYDLLIIGSGPAGMTAAIYGKRAELNVAIFEKGAPGGQVLNTAFVDNYPGFKHASGYELASSMFEHVLSLGVETKFEEVIDVKDFGEYKEVITTTNSYQAKSLLIASGTVPRKLRVKGEENFIYRGISWCAICDGALYKDKDVLVVGGGNSAVEETIYLSSIARKITIVQNLDHLTAEKSLVQKLKTISNVEVLYEANVLEFKGNESLESVIVKHRNEEKEIKVDGVFEYIGLIPVTNFLKNLPILNNQGYIQTNEFLETKIPGIFAAGDVIEKHVRQIVTATNDGAIAVQSVLKYINK